MVFPGGATVKALREARTGRWRDINVNGASTALTRKYLTIWYDHGVNPTNGSYLYQLMPGATSTATQARAADPGWLTVLTNTRYQQGVKVASRGVTAVNFWVVDAGTPVVDGITVDQPAAVLIRQTGNSAVISLSDPRQNLGTITLTWQRAVSAVTSADSSVTVLQTGSQLVLRFAVTASAGATHQATVTLT
jgi:hyaluronate lyase